MKLKSVLIILVLGYLFYVLIGAYLTVPFGENKMRIAQQYLDKTPEELKVANVVTAVVVNYRGFDTLGEVTVLFLASTALGSILFRRRDVHTELNPRRTTQQASRIVTVAGKILFPLMVLLGAYVFIHGHLTPGGGFQGGVIIATGYLFMLIAYRRFAIKHSTVTWIESLAGATFAGLGIMGLILGYQFLQNFLDTGELNKLISGGIIPLIYIAVGFKVAAELTGILDTVLSIGIDVDEKDKNN